MKRIILYTAKRIDKPLWVEGMLFYSTGYELNKKSLRPCIQEIDWIKLEYKTYEVIPETIGEFTGKTTTNEHPAFYDVSKLYENQIFSIGNNKTRYKAVFENYEWIGVSNEGDDHGVFKIRFSAIKEPIYIHGNIFDNPELMNLINNR